MQALLSGKLASGLIHAIDLIERFCFRLSCIGVFLMMLLVSVDVIARYAFNSPIVGAYEITEDYLMAIIVFLGLSHSFKKGAFVRVTSLVQFVPLKARRILDTVFSAASIVVFAVIAVGGLSATFQAARIGEFSSNILHYPLAPAYFLVVVGSVMLCARLIQSLFLPSPEPDEDAANAPSFD